MYALIIWTVVAMSGQPQRHSVERDWRQLAEFHDHNRDITATARDKCEAAAAQLGLDAKSYRCIRLK